LVCAVSQSIKRQFKDINLQWEGFSTSISTDLHENRGYKSLLQRCHITNGYLCELYIITVLFSFPNFWIFEKETPR